VDLEAIRRDLEGRCFICELVVGNLEFAHVLVYEDEDAVAFLNKYPPLTRTCWSHRESTANR